MQLGVCWGIRLTHLSEQKLCSNLLQSRPTFDTGLLWFGHQVPTRQQQSKAQEPPAFDLQPEAACISQAQLVYLPC